MKDSFLLRLLLSVLFASIVVTLFYGYDVTARKKPAQMANPASVYCLNQGNKLEIRTDTQGNQYGVCIFPDEKECEEWAFFRGECNRISQFCGTSTRGKCNTDLNCVVSGCSGQVCQSANEESTVTDCRYSDCYDATKFGLSCRCLNQQCQWAK